AFLVHTFYIGMVAIILLLTAAMLAGSATSNSTDLIPGLAFVVSAKWPLRRPEMITWLPSLCSVSASPRPIPEPPPVTKIVLPVSFIWSPLLLLVLIVSRRCVHRATRISRPVCRHRQRWTHPS